MTHANPLTAPAPATDALAEAILAQEHGAMSTANGPAAVPVEAHLAHEHGATELAAAAHQ